MNIRALVLTSLFAALIAAGAYIAIPIGPVPITLQTLFILTAGLLGGRKIGLSAVTVYLIAGAAGLPVFSGGTGGIAHFVGPTGGFLIASIPAVLVCGILSDLAGSRNSLLRYLVIVSAALISSVIFYLLGVPWLKISLALDWERAAAVGMLPFIPGDMLKIAAATALFRLFRQRITMLIDPEAAA
jgi:biotin transport system substrate-specific component